MDVFAALSSAGVRQHLAEFIDGLAEVIAVEGIARTGNAIDFASQFLFLQVLIKVHSFVRQGALVVGVWADYTDIDVFEVCGVREGDFGHFNVNVAVF